ncbi:MAG: ATP-binding cassette domain-containing protein, partial [Gammaproteobacteria bacterium]
MSDFQANNEPITHISDDTILYLNGVSVSFDGFKAINNLSLYVKKNELRSIIGPNGAGKTTMMDIITGKTRPDEGRVIYDDMVDLTTISEAEIANLGIGRKFQKPTVFENHSVYENLKLALEGRRKVFENLFFKLTNEDHDKI